MNKKGYPKGLGYVIGIVLGVLMYIPFFEESPGLIGAGVAIGVALGVAFEQSFQGERQRKIESRKIIALGMGAVLLGAVVLVFLLMAV